MFHSIAYISTSNDLSQFEINELMHTTKLKNEELSITGILMFSDNNFFQIIEGKKKIIHELYAKIECDQRHFDIIKIFDRQIFYPFFTSFESSYTTISKNGDYAELQKFLEKEKVSNPKGHNNISYLVYKFMKLC